MSIRTRIASIMVAALMAISLGTPAIAQEAGETGDLPVDIVVGSSPDAGLRWNITQTSEFDNVPFSLEDQESTGAMTATITDTRGTRAGWTLTVRGTDFVGQDTGDSFSADNLLISPRDVQVINGQSDPMPQTNSFTMSSTTPQTLITAASGAGNGKYGVIIAGTVTVPGATVVDTYTSTLTVSLDVGP